MPASYLNSPRARGLLSVPSRIAASLRSSTPRASVQKARVAVLPDEDLLIVVDEKDTPISTAGKQHVHENGEILQLC